MNKPTEPRKNGHLSLVMATASLTSITGFTLMIGGKILSARGRESLLKSPTSWWIYSFAWHYFVFPLALIYFFKYSAEGKFSKRKILYLTIPLPILYFSANLSRSLLASEKYFNNKPFLGNGIWWFNYLEKKEYGLLLAWITFSIFYFWVVSYSLLKFKKWLHSSDSLLLKNKQDMKLYKKKNIINN